MAAYVPAHDATNIDDVVPKKIKEVPQSPASVNVVVIGATGATGRYLIAELLLAPEIECVTIVSRRKYEIPSDYNSSFEVLNAPKEGRLIEHVVDLEEISDEKLRGIFEGAHTYFNCLGTTKKIAGSKERFIQIDMDIPLRFARIAKEGGVKHASLLSSSGSDDKSFFLYLKVKGRIETGFRDIKFPNLSIWKPGLLGRKEAARLGEKMFRIISQPLQTDDLARAMVQETLLLIRGMSPANPPMYQNPQIKQLNLDRLSELQTIIRAAKIASVVPTDKNIIETIEAKENKRERELVSTKELSLEDKTFQPGSQIENEQQRVKIGNEVEGAGVSTEGSADEKPVVLVNKIETQLETGTPTPESPSATETNQTESQADAVTPSTHSPSIKGSNQTESQEETVIPVTDSPSAPDTTYTESEVDTVIPPKSLSTRDSKQAEPQEETLIPATESIPAPDTNRTEPQVVGVLIAPDASPAPDTKQTESQVDFVKPANQSTFVPDFNQADCQVDTIPPDKKPILISAIVPELGQNASPPTETKLPNLEIKGPDEFDLDTTPTSQTADKILKSTPVSKNPYLDSDIIQQETVPIDNSPAQPGDTTLSIEDKLDNDTTSSSFQTAVSSELSETVDSHSPESLSSPSSP